MTPFPVRRAFDGVKLMEVQDFESAAATSLPSELAMQTDSSVLLCHSLLLQANVFIVVVFGDCRVEKELFFLRGFFFAR